MRSPILAINRRSSMAVRTCSSRCWARRDAMPARPSEWAACPAASASKSRLSCWSGPKIQEADMSIDSLKQEIARRYGTPAHVIDLDIVERNIARLQSACDAVGIANRPHIKTHKSPVLAAMQIAAGAKGITCQKLGEAEVMAD